MKIENDFTTEESLAVVRLIWLLLFSDDAVDPNEADYFDKTLQDLKVSPQEFQASLSLPLASAYETIRQMPSGKRRECGTLLRLAVTSDGVVELTELSRLNDILEEAAVFRPDRRSSKKSEGGF